MFEDESEGAPEKPMDPAVKAKEKSDYFRIHAELAAVFEGKRKFDASLLPGLDPESARDIQRGVAKLEKSKSPESPILPPAVLADAGNLLDLHRTHGLTTNDYHIHRRPGEVQIVRWLEGEQVATFYERIQAHFDAGFNHFRDEEGGANEWKQEEKTLAYLKALGEIEVKMEERYLRKLIKDHKLIVLSTQAADELNIVFLADHLMSVAPEEIVGNASAPEGEHDEPNLAWFFKLFSLRGVKDGVEQMLFFAFLQKAEDTFGDSW